jgi:hypothetical protein
MKPRAKPAGKQRKSLSVDAKFALRREGPVTLPPRNSKKTPANRGSHKK